MEFAVQILGQVKVLIALDRLSFGRNGSDAVKRVFH
jgi:hypothetical protein